MKKRFFLLSLLIATTMMASATVTKTIGQVTGNPNPYPYDYASLHAACIDLKDHPLTEDCVWEICTDLTETINAGITNNTEHSLTIRPNSATLRTITYTTASDNVGPSGNVVIGGDPKSTQSSNIPWVAIPTNNVVIDGQYNGDGERHLKFIGSDAGGRTMVLYGAVTNSAIKNCVIDAPRVRTNSYSTYAIEIRVEQLAGGAPPAAANKTDNSPIGTLIENCQLSVLNSVNAQTIVFNGAYSKNASGRPKNTTIKNCEILSNLRGIFFNGAINADIEGCTFRLSSASPGYLAHGIMGNAQTGTINVKSCKFLELKTNNVSVGDYGIQGITASGGATVWNIENNIFTGLDALASGASSKAIKLCAVRCGDPCVVRHNTFIMPALTNHPTTAITSTTPISLLYLAGSTNTVQNNIFISNETTSNNSLIRGAMNANCTGNVFYHKGGNAYVVAGAALCQDMEAVRTYYPTQAAVSKWFDVDYNTTTFALKGTSIGNEALMAASIAEVTTDINGTTRNNPTYAGAEEAATALSNVETLYLIGGNNAFNATVGEAMTKVSSNIFTKHIVFADTKYFCFSSVLAQNNDDGGWDYVNAHRFAGLVENDEPRDGMCASMAYAVADRNFTLPAGEYDFEVNTYAMTLKVYCPTNTLYEIGDNQVGGWHANSGVAMTPTANANEFTGEFVFTADPSYFSFTKVLAQNDDDGGWAYLNKYRYAGLTPNQLATDGATMALKPYGGINFSIAPGTYTMTVNMNDKTLDIVQSIAQITVSAAGYATYFNSTRSYTMPENMEGYVYNETNGLVKVFNPGQIVAANVPLVLKAPAGTYQLVFSNEAGLAPEVINQLRGTDNAATTTAPASGTYHFYALSLEKPEGENPADPTTVGFYWMKANGAAFTNGAHKAYLALAYTPEASAPSRILFNENDATDIQSIEAQEKAVKFIENGRVLILKDGVTYDVMGRIVR